MWESCSKYSNQLIVIPQIFMKGCVKKKKKKILLTWGIFINQVTFYTHFIMINPWAAYKPLFRAVIWRVQNLTLVNLSLIHPNLTWGTLYHHHSILRHLSAGLKELEAFCQNITKWRWMHHLPSHSKLDTISYYSIQYQGQRNRCDKKTPHFNFGLRSFKKSTL